MESFVAGNYHETNIPEVQIYEECLRFFTYKNSLENKVPQEEPDLTASIEAISSKGILYFHDLLTGVGNNFEQPEDIITKDLVDSIRFGAIVAHLSEKELISGDELSAPKYLDDAKMAKEELTLLLRGTVCSVVHEVAGLYPNAEIDDLMQEGYMGMLKAVWLFDSSRGRTFNSYANIRVRGHTIDYLRANYSAIRIPKGVRSDIGAVDKCKQEGVFKLSEIAEKLGISIGRVMTALECSQFGIDYLSQYSDKDGNPITQDGCSVLVSDDSTEVAIQQIDSRDQIKYILSQIEFADTRQRDMFCKKLGICQYLNGADEWQEKTHEQVGDEYGVSFTRSCQIVGDARRRFRRFYEDNLDV